MRIIILLAVLVVSASAGYIHATGKVQCCKTVSDQVQEQIPRAKRAIGQQQQQQDNQQQQQDDQQQQQQQDDQLDPNEVGIDDDDCDFKGKGGKGNCNQKGNPKGKAKRDLTTSCTTPEKIKVRLFTHIPVFPDGELGHFEATGTDTFEIIHDSFFPTQFTIDPYLKVEAKCDGEWKEEHREIDNHTDKQRHDFLV